MQDLIKQMKNDPGVKYLAMQRNLMEIRKRRMMAAGDLRALNSETPLEGPEKMAFDKISHQLKNYLIQKSKLTEQQADDLLNYAMEPLGKKHFARSFIEPTLIMGIPYNYFVISSVVCLTAFIATQSFSILLLVAPAVHLALFFYYAANRERMRKEKLNIILTEGIKI